MCSKCARGGDREKGIGRTAAEVTQWISLVVLWWCQPNLEFLFHRFWRMGHASLNVTLHRWVTEGLTSIWVTPIFKILTNEAMVAALFNGSYLRGLGPSEGGGGQKSCRKSLPSFVHQALHADKIQNMWQTQIHAQLFSLFVFKIVIYTSNTPNSCSKRFRVKDTSSFISFRKNKIMLTECLLCPRHCSKYLACIKLYFPLDNPRECFYYQHFTCKKPGAQGR